jgi:WXG100 family type VII secretion target
VAALRRQPQLVYAGHGLWTTSASTSASDLLFVASRAIGASARYQEVGVSGIRVTPEQLASLSSRVSSGSASIEGELRSLTGSLAPLGSDWAGVAQQRFQALWAEWQKSAEGLRDALGGISQLLGQASTSYAEAERQIAASFGNV